GRGGADTGEGTVELVALPRQHLRQGAHHLGHRVEVEVLGDRVGAGSDLVEGVGNGGAGQRDPVRSVVDPDGTEIEIPLAEDGCEPDRCGGGVAHGALLVEAEVDVDVGTGEPDALHAPGRHARDVDRIAGGESGGVGELGR